uniref:SCP domain-containing protein n=1 Tax=Strongyloides papillosus TaxID=174720 RepID=A0A0N5BL24_STREA
MKKRYNPIRYWTRGESKIIYSRLERTVPPNFGQIIWASSREIGCGISKGDKNDSALTLCLFSPRGNIKGRYYTNIHKPIKKNFKSIN